MGIVNVTLSLLETMAVAVAALKNKIACLRLQNNNVARLLLGQLALLSKYVA